MKINIVISKKWSFLLTLTELLYFLSLNKMLFWFLSLWSESSCDLLLTLSHSYGNLNESVRDGFVTSKLHKLWGHWDAKFLGHLFNLIFLWFGLESTGDSFKWLLCVHQSLELCCWVTLANIVLILSLLLSSLLISLGDSLVHLSLHLSPFFLSSSNGVILTISNFCI